MSECSQCEHNGYRYEFSTLISQTNFDAAQLLCKINGGTLARYLDEDAYLELRKCCQNGGNYWIGLFENPLCNGSPVGPYTWVGDTACTSGSPLDVTPLQDSMTNNQAVIILLNSNLDAPLLAQEKNDDESYHYICQNSSVTSTTLAASPPTIVTTSFSNIKGTSTSAESTTAKTTSKSFTTQLPVSASASLSSAVSATSNVSNFTTSTVLDDDSSALIAGLVVGGIILIIALMLFYFYFYKNGYHKNATRHTTGAAYFTSNDGKGNNTKEVKENPLYGRVTTTAETYQVCHVVNDDSVTGLGSNPENEYQMENDENSNEYHAIPDHAGTNNDPNPSSNYYVIPDPSKPSVKYTIVRKKKKTPDPSNECNIPGKPNSTSSHSRECELDCVENDYNKLYFTQQQNDATSSTYARLNYENNAPRSNNTNKTYT